MRPTVERFMAKVEMTGSCWLWKAYIRPDGYGQFRLGATTVKAHRWAYEHFIGTISDGLEADHLCRNRSCVNPHHLEMVTHAENMRRLFAARTHCIRGHEFTDESTRLESDGRWTRRQCVLCRRERDKARRRKALA